MPTPFHASANRKATFYSTGQKKIGLIERIAVIGSATAIAFFVVVDFVKAEGHPAPTVTSVVRSATETEPLRPAIAANEQWAADESANGTRPDASH